MRVILIRFICASLVYKWLRMFLVLHYTLPCPVLEFHFALPKIQRIPDTYTKINIWKRHINLEIIVRGIKCHGGLPYKLNIIQITLLCIARTGLLRVSVKWRFLGSLGFDDGVWIAKHLKPSKKCTV